MSATTATVIVIDNFRTGHANTASSGTNAAPGVDVGIPTLVLSNGSTVTTVTGEAGLSYSCTGQTLDVYLGGQMVTRIALSTAVASALGTALSTPAATNFP
jgi:hypothetical protein